MVNSNGKFTWNLNEIAKALKIKEEDVRLYFTDGRGFPFC